MNKYVLGIDQSLSCTALCLMEYDPDDETYFLADMKLIKTKKDKSLDNTADILARCKIIADGIKEFIEVQAFFIDLIVMEDLAYGASGSATRTLAILLGYLMADLNYTSVTAPIGTVKKFATGNGNATKDEMLQAVKEDCPPIYSRILDSAARTTGQYDLADAYWLSKVYIEDI